MTKKSNEIIELNIIIRDRLVDYGNARQKLCTGDVIVACEWTIKCSQGTMKIDIKIT